MADEETQLVALEKLRKENSELESAIAALEGNASTKAATKVFVETKAAVQGIKVLNYGTSESSDWAGMDHGSPWGPPQCSRRTVLGGFHTS